MNNKIKKYNNLSKTISHALRHQPSLYNLELDKDGWVDVNLLIESIQKLDSSFSFLSILDIDEMITISKKKRHELKGNKIRASYGHSIQGKIIKKSSNPPKYLYHATKQEALPNIFEKGLLPMKRQYVHLSENKEDAITVALRKTKEPILLEINSLKAYSKGVKFYSESNNLWLSDKISARYLEQVEP